MKIPKCHPKLAYYAKGMCRSCYEINLRKINIDFNNRQKENCKKWVARNSNKKKKIDKEYRSSPKQKERKRINSRINTIKSFGMTIDQYEDMIKNQNGVCAICKKLPQRENFDIDHDHKTGEVRGLLCGKCNKGIGLLGDNIEGLTEALKYLLKIE